MSADEPPGARVPAVRRGRLSITTSVLMGADLSNLCVQRRPGDVRTCRNECVAIVHGYALTGMLAIKVNDLAVVQMDCDEASLCVLWLAE